MGSSQSSSFNKRNKHATHSIVRLKDDDTEGYNVIPNFFISARLDKHYSYKEDGLQESDKNETRRKNFQFKNRLFDRDTLLLFHYDVNFLFVLSMYGKNNSSEISQWKTDIREKFRKTIQSWLQDDFSFYAMQPHPGIDTKVYIRNHFKEVIGKVYAPFEESSILSLALDKGKEFEDSNKELLDELRKSFYVEECGLGDDPEPVMAQAQAKGFAPHSEQGKNGVLAVRWELSNNAMELNDGRIAIPLLQDAAGQRVMEKITELGYVLFHTYDNQNNQHLYAINGDCRVQFVMSESEYKKLPNTKEALLYLVMDLDMATKFDLSQIHSANLPKIAGTMKFNNDYNVQYCALEKLKS